MKSVATQSTMPAAVPPEAASGAARALSALLKPTLSEWSFVVILLWLFFGQMGAGTLLGDADTGWHIHAGEYVLEHGRPPATDPFSFTMEGREWFAWEWLADAALAAAHRLGGLKGVVLLSGAVIAATAALTLSYMLWRGVNILLAIIGMLMICGVSTMHWLARPHMFTWGFFLATLWLLEADRRRAGRRVWWLVPMTALWTNMHGGFAAGVATIALFGAGAVLEDCLDLRKRGEKLSLGRPPASLGRYAALFTACLAATLVNPYGYQLHVHIVEYLRSDFILKYVQEFQSPEFRDYGTKMLEVGIIAALLVSGRMLMRGKIAWPLLIAAWTHLTLTSVRHAPLFMVVAVPVLAEEFSAMIADGARKGNSYLKALKELADDYGGRGRAGAKRRVAAPNWAPAAALALIAFLLNTRGEERKWKAEFPAIRFPALACDALAGRIEGRRILTTDQWGDYLVYRLYPEYKTFFDGRSDFFDDEVRRDYLLLMGGGWKAEAVLGKYGFDAALLPLEWALSESLQRRPEWELVYDDGFALFFERRRGESIGPREAAAGRPRKAAAGRPRKAAAKGAGGLSKTGEAPGRTS